MLITDRRSFGGALLDIVREALAGGVDWVQLREKDLGARELLDFAMPLRVLTRKQGARLVINDRLDVALAVGACGYHAGFRSIPADIARRVAGKEMLIGVSTHSEGEARAAERQGADYVTFGPVFSTPSKDGLLEPRGPVGLRSVTQAVRIPVLAVGGLGPDNAGIAIAAGAAGIAAIRALGGGEARETARAMREAIRSAAGGGPHSPDA